MTSTLSRRGYLHAVAGAVGIAGIAGVARGQATTFELGGQASGWQGRSPESIANETNPTLEMEVGKSYVVVWENVDGQPHNLAISDGEGDVMKRTTVVEQRGATQTLEFTAKPKMATYFSEVNPETMRGKIVTSQPTTTTNSTTNATTTSATTGTTTTTEATSTTATTIATTTTTDTTGTTGTTATTTTGTGNDDGQPGFGLLAALASLAGGAYLLRRRGE